MRNSKYLLTTLACICLASLTGLAQARNDIYIEINPCDFCVQPCEKIEVAVKLSDLQQRINLVAATINIPSDAFCATAIRPGDPYWTDVISETRTVDGATVITFQMGLLPAELKTRGTIADGTLAVLTLTACDTPCANGVIQIVTAVANAVASCEDPCPVATTINLACGAEATKTIKVDSVPPVVTIGDITHEFCSANLNLTCCPCTAVAPLPNPCCGDPAAYGSCRPGTCEDLNCAGPGIVHIYVTATDDCDNALRRPSVQVITACGVVEDITHTGKRTDKANEWKYEFEVKNDTARGLATVLATATDCAGNVSDVAEAHFKICPRLRISGLIELQGFVGSLREVTFVVTPTAGNGEPLTTTRVVAFEYVQGYCDRVGIYEIAVPWAVNQIASIAAKTPFNVTSKCNVQTADYYCGHLVVDFVGPNGHLLAGDIYTGPAPVPASPLGNDTVDFGDKSVVETAIGLSYFYYWADINGDGVVNVADRALVVNNENIVGPKEFQQP